MRRRALSCLSLMLCLLPGLAAQTSLSPATKEVSAGRAVYRLFVDSFDAWTAASSESWVRLSRTSGTGGAWIEVDVAPNRSDVTRTADVMVNGAVHAITQHTVVSGVTSLYRAGGNPWPGLRRPGVVCTDVAAVESGSGHTLILKQNGSLLATGWNEYGNLGDGTRVHRSTPVPVAEGVSAISAGYAHSLFLKTDGTLWGMGWDRYGQLGGSAENIVLMPIQIAVDVTSMAAGSSFSMFVTSDGSLWAIGHNSQGQLGDGTTTDRRSPVLIDHQVASVSAGHICYYLKTDGTLWRTGRSVVDDQTVYTPVQIDAEVQSVAAGEMHLLYIKRDSVLWALGDSYAGGMGSSDSTGASLRQVATDVTAAAGGYGHSLFVKTDGTLWSLGDNRFGQLGDGTDDDRTSPVLVAHDVVTVTAGDFQSLFLKTDGSLWAMGWDIWGQLGYGSAPRGGVPTHLAPNVAQVSSAISYVTYLANDGGLWAFGYHPFAEHAEYTTLGREKNRGDPMQVATGVIRIDAGRSKPMLLKNDATLWTPHRESSLEPLSYELVLSSVCDMAQGDSFNLYLKTDGTLWAQGSNQFGQLGDGSNEWRMAPVCVSTDVKAVAACWHTAYFLKIDGTLWGMGENSSGQLGDGTTVAHNTPVMIAAGVMAIALGNQTGMFVKFDGSLWLAGTVQLLDNNAPSSDGRPYRIGREATTVWISEGVYFYRKTDGSVWGFGADDDAQLGDGRERRAGTPVPIASGVEGISGRGAENYFVLKADGGFYALRDTPEVTWENPASITYGVTLGAGQLSAATVAPGSFGYTPITGTMLPAGTHVLSATFTPEDVLGVNPVTLERTLVVNKAPQVITFEVLPDRPYDPTPLPLVATADSGLPVIFEIVSGPAVIEGTNLHLLAQGSVTIRAMQAGDANHEAAPTVERSFTAGPGYASWWEANFSPAQQAEPEVGGATADPDHDNLPNLVEYALGGDPWQPSMSSLPQISADGTHWLYTYTTAADRSDVSCEVEMSVDLSTWVPSEVEPVLLTTAELSETWQVRQPLSQETVYFRLKVRR